MTTNALIEELKWRNLLHDKTPGLEEQLNKELTTGYVGFDPTADSLHIGNLVPIMLLVHLQRAGHKPIALVGGATGMVGDPSGKTQERQLLSIDDINHNLECQKKQLKQFLDFSDKPNGAMLVNNYDWFKELGFLNFIRDVGKHISVNYMMAKDSVKNRLENVMSFTEFSYKLIQGYDFFHLFKEEGVRLQMGGSVLWGNITTGTELIRRMTGGEAYALTAPLVKKADGTKFGKSEGGNVWLDRNKTSPYKFYQFWLNISDEDALNWFRIFSLKSREEIEQIENELREAPHTRAVQHALAEELTIRVHSAEDLEQAKNASAVLFGKNTSEQLKTLEESLLLDIFEGVPQATVSRSLIEAGCPIAELFADHSNFFPSRGEVRKMVKGGGVSLNKAKVEDTELMVGVADLLQDKYLLAQRGKKDYCLIIVK
ncbi:MAG: tyrosine--tRNA ligase [Bacteroidota bacterium]|nr:tyrosine--tRNA ligase [Bacteroidota bacterium]MDX5430838.1 tyrosine--tRNA ligase [Bacteroidota bacterium]MDX5469582.1 tyrosine--tRNA ligase [Bacteroidota bacterium]